MRITEESYPRIKNILHGIQGFIIFIAWVLTIDVLTRSGSNDGRTGWYFGLCWLSLPILLYLSAVPMWPRSRRFGNIYAFAALDGVSVILWLAAWAAVASYVAGGRGKGKATDLSGCDNFALGSPGKCRVSIATVILGVFVMFLFCATSYFSFRNVMNYRRTGEMPSTGVVRGGEHDFASQTQDAFSSNIRNDDLDDEEVDMDSHSNVGRTGPGSTRRSDEDKYALLHQAENEDLSQIPPTLPHEPLGYGRGGGNTPRPDVIHDYDTSYGGAYGRHSPNPAQQDAGYGSGPSPYGR